MNAILYSSRQHPGDGLGGAAAASGQMMQTLGVDGNTHQPRGHSLGPGPPPVPPSTPITTKRVPGHILSPVQPINSTE